MAETSRGTRSLLRLLMAFSGARRTGDPSATSRAAELGQRWVRHLASRLAGAVEARIRTATIYCD